MRIRRATLDDATLLATVHIESWRTAYRGLVPDSYLAALEVSRRADGFRREMAEGAADVAVAERDAKAVGFVTFGPSQDPDVDRDGTGEIRAIYILPACWRGGVGRLLCGHAERSLRASGRSLAVLWVFGENAQARRFYEAMGFATDGACRILNYGLPLQVVRYRKSLVGAEQDPTFARGRASASRPPAPDG